MRRNASVNKALHGARGKLAREILASLPGSERERFEQDGRTNGGIAS